MREEPGVYREKREADMCSRLAEDMLLGLRAFESSDFDAVAVKLGAGCFDPHTGCNARPPARPQLRRPGGSLDVGVAFRVPNGDPDVHVPAFSGLGLPRAANIADLHRRFTSERLCGPREHSFCSPDPERQLTVGPSPPAKANAPATPASIAAASTETGGY